MRRYLLDSAPLAGLLNGREPFVSRFQALLQRGELATSILVYAEVVEYLMGAPDFERRQRQLRTFLHAVYPYFLTYPTLDRYAAIRRSLRSPHGPGLIGDVDTLIAATALERDLILITTDRHFLRVPNLKLMLLPR